MFIFSDSIKEEALEKILERIRGEIAKLGGRVAETRMMGRRFFARPLKSQESGQYVKIMVELEPDKFHALLGRLKLVEDIFRVQIVQNEGKRIEKKPSGKVSDEKEAVADGQL